MRTLLTALLAAVVIAGAAYGHGEIMCVGAPPVTGVPIAPSSVTSTSGTFGFVDAGILLVQNEFRTMTPILDRQTGTHTTFYTCSNNVGVGATCGSNQLDFIASNGNPQWSLDTNGHFVASGAKNITTTGVVDVGSLTLVTLAASSTAPTVTACSGGTAATMTTSNGTAAFVFDVGTACAGESTAVLTFPAATTGWLCSCSSTTADRVLQQKVIPPASTTQVTIQNIVMSTGANGDFTDSADVGCVCTGY